MLVGSYNPLFVVLSILVAILASFTALDMASRVSASQPRRTAARWLLAGGVAMGAGIWSMHFVGMLAFRLPIPLGYDLWLTLQSLLVAVAASLFALWLVSRPTLPHLRLALGALLMGLGIAWMHYVGMAALRMQPSIDYDRFWFALSIVIAVCASWSALYIAFRLRTVEHAQAPRLIAAVVMGLAIVGMHYTGMAAARFPADAVCAAATSGGVPTEWLAACVVLLTVGVMGIVLTISLLEQRMQARLLHLRNSMLAASLDDARKELFHASQHDSLTRLPNRQLSHERIEQLLLDGQALAVMSIDLDGFHHINGAFGAPIGDAVLVDIAERLRSLLPADDLVGRLGGDQFVIATPVKDAKQVEAYAERIILAVNSVRVNGRDMRITGSLGIALSPEHGGSAPPLVALAETAMRYAKQAGHNTHTMFAEWMSENVEQDRQLLEDLRKAIGTPQLSLHYQPRVDAQTGRISGAEAQLRWRHPEHGYVPSERIIRLAEQNGLMQQLGDWALNEACRQLRSWQDAGNQEWRVSVMLSERQLGSQQLLDEVRAALQRHELAPSQLILEISENAVMRDTDNAISVLRNVAALGVGISINDFGTGSASLLHLKRLPTTEIKISRAFVLALEDSDEDVVIVSAMIALGHALSLSVVASGVETAGQRAYVERLGCDHLQGNLLGRPVSAESFMRLHGGDARQAALEARLASFQSNAE
ncbi:EAL domain-containing protein [Stenotrophomonas sp. SY1]|uniref:putative bifunctional diguanylate cyclase/phosphodiesterase n=1 Tax=Stenotrophomonas sp. SY1 TaxID=477235 RepID=UPI001E40A80E|nr:EAL domain-containing protein [Stenotrophomonas sp. SY1]MCD9087168.1 EAL domain-containing protein [Stenotrophomonas sp. SY1]